jgi:transcriptional regulator of acetoin/glycerol metabolism
MTTTQKIRRESTVDALPEQMAYQDTGCEVSRSCLHCPLPICKYDDPVWYQQYRRRGRDLLVLEAYKRKGGNATTLAEHFGVSPRTIHRALRRMQSPATLSA